MGGIYENQNISESLKKELLSLGEIIRDNIIDSNFRDGATNPSEFCKTKKAWEKFKKLKYSISHLDKKDIISGEAIEEKKENSKNLSETSSSVSSFEEVLKIDKEEWGNIEKYLMSSYGKNDYKIGVLSRLARGKTDLELKDYDIALSLLKVAIKKGYILTS